MAFETISALPRRRESHYGDRVVWCFEERVPFVYAGFERAAREHPQAIALRFEGRSWSYAALEADAARAAAGLRAAGVKRGDRVAMQVRNRPAFVVLFLAIQRLAAVAVPIDVRLLGPEVGHVVADSGATVLLHDREMEDRVPEARKRVASLVAIALPEDDAGELFASAAQLDVPAAEPVDDEEQAAVILYTSGTTGKPKGAAITHLNIAHSVIHHAGNLGMGPDDRSLVAVPLSHVTGLLCGILAPLFTGGTLVLLAYFKAREFLAAAAECRMTYTIMVPAMYNLCLRVEEFDSHDLSSWRLGHFGGSPMPQATIDALAARVPGLQLVNGYGATEVCSPATMWPVDGAKVPLTSVGKPMPCAEIIVVDPQTGIEVPVGESGELWIRGPMVVREYWNDPEATANAFVGGFWRSGDMGSIDAEGNVYVHDRLKDMINRGGYKIYSAEVENVLLQFAGLVEAAVVAKADPVLGERVHAFVTANKDIATEALAAFCAERLADYKVPESWTVVREPLPRTATGKVDKKALRASMAAA